MGDTCSPCGRLPGSAWWPLSTVVPQVAPSPHLSVCVAAKSKNQNTSSSAHDQYKVRTLRWSRDILFRLDRVDHGNSANSTRSKSHWETQSLQGLPLFRILATQPLYSALFSCNTSVWGTSFLSKYVVTWGENS